MRHILRTKRTFAVTLTAALAAVGATWVGWGGPASSAAKPESSAPYAARTIDWAACDEASQAQCGTLEVPMDWSHPGGRGITLAIARRPAGDPAHRIGTLFYNPGGPNDGGTDYVRFADQIFSSTLLKHFDLVAMDPRGVGASTPIRCAGRAVRADDTLFPQDRAEYRAMVRDHAAFASSCERAVGDYLYHLDTVSVARDHEALRRALGVDQVSWLGVSYGTQVALNYAERFPQHTRAVVVDAALDHSGTELTNVMDEIAAVEDAFNRFTRWCDKNDGCALHGQDVGSAYDALVRRADRHPIPVDGALRPVTGEDIRMGTPGLLTFKEPSIYGPEMSWPGLSQALAAAMNGDASAFALPAGEEAVHGIDPLFGNACGDYESLIRTWPQMQQRLQMARELAPHLQGASETWQVWRCSGWLRKPANPFRPLDVRGVPTLVVNATHDPSTSYTGALRVTSQVQGSDLLTRQGDGHTSYHSSECARSAMDRFLMTAAGPASSVCTS